MPIHAEYKRRFNPATGKREYRYVHGEGVFDSLKSFGRRFAGRPAKRAAAAAIEKTIEPAAEEKQAAKQAASPAPVGTAGDEIVKLLQAAKIAQEPAAREMSNKARIANLLRGGRV